MIKLVSSHPLNHMFQNTIHIYFSIKFSYASTHEIGKIITSLKTKKNSHDSDKVSVKIQIWSNPFFISPPTYICNKCLELGIFPYRLKFSIVKPVFKTRDL